VPTGKGQNKKMEGEIPAESVMSPRGEGTAGGGNWREKNRSNATREL